ncbi:MAG: TonB-dependent receptor plug domain-containing protein [Bacteroidota bacterium]
MVRLLLTVSVVVCTVLCTYNVRAQQPINTSSNGQNTIQSGTDPADSIVLNNELKGRTIGQLFEHVYQKYAVKYYIPQNVAAQRVDFEGSSIFLSTYLRSFKKKFQLKKIAYKPGVMVFAPSNGNTNIQEEKGIYTLSGSLVNANTGEYYAGGSAFVKNISKNFNTDTLGRFDMPLPEGTYQIIFKALGSFEKVIEVDVYKNTYLDVELVEETIELEDIVIRSERIEDRLRKPLSSISAFDVQSMSSLPHFLGEIDVNNAIKTLPGISSVGEGSTGFNVRGGNIDQNLILLDGAPVFNNSHLFGFFSIFNPDFISEFAIYKGVIPSNFGGRASSTLEVKQKVSNKEKVKFKTSVGPVASKVFLDVPLKKDKAGLLVGYRNAYPTWILRSFANDDLKRSKASYWDLNLKGDVVKGNNNFEVSFYTGFDEFNLNSDTTFNYTNDSFSFQWENNASEERQMRANFSMSHYTSGLDIATFRQAGEYQNGIRQFNLKYLYSFAVADLQVTTGVEGNHYRFDEERLTTVGEESSLEARSIDERKAVDLAYFLDVGFEINSKTSGSIGLRYSNFWNVGGLYPVFQNNAERNAGNVIDTLDLGTNQLRSLAGGLEPRLALSHLITPSLSLKGGYSLTRQYIHLYTNTVASLPTDPWKPSTINVKPLITNQYSLALVKNLGDGDYEMSVEAFYKTLNDLIVFKGGTNVLLNEQIDTQTLQGDAQARGIEFSISKTPKKGIRGNLNYSYTRTEVQIESAFATETINEGRNFPADFDRPHKLVIYSDMKLSRLWSFNFLFTYNSGRPVTLPRGKFAFDNYILYSGVERNNFRIPDTHRLDIAFTIKGTNKRNAKWDSSWTFSVYNFYGRRNPYSVFLDNSQGFNTQARRLAVLGAPFPSLSLNLKLR